MEKKNVKKAATTVETKAKETAKAVEEKAKETAKAVEEKVKETAKETAKVAEATVKKAAVKTAAKAPAKKTVAKEAVKSEIIVQYQNREVDTAKLEERVKAQFVSEGHKAGSIKKLNIYVKPEEYSAYYVINDKFSGRVDLF